jgi:hypothetical protein
VTILHAIAAFLAEIWRGIWGRITDEPVMTLALVQGILALAVTFGLRWTPEQVGAFLAATAALLGWVARSRVEPV